VRDSVADVTKAVQLLGFVPAIDLQAGLARTLSSLRTARVPGSMLTNLK